MFRKTVKTIIMVAYLLDIIFLLTRDPGLALGRTILLITIVWAWKLY